MCVSFNTKEPLELTLKSYVKHHYEGKPLKLALWDNHSVDGTDAWLRDNEIPVNVHSHYENIGHEAALEIMYPLIETKYVLLSDSDVLYLQNCNHYFDLLKDGVVAAGDLIRGDNLGSPVKPRLGAWSIWFDIEACREAGITWFRRSTNWSYDVASEFYENIWTRNLGVHIIPRLPGHLDYDIEGMKYGTHSHYGKLSWSLEKHSDRKDEIERRRVAITERLKEFEDIDLRGKFVF